jgi:D-serine deaminase-like pyridoxal phosphate-dependent protein
VARHGDRVILDAGRKSIGIDYVTPPMLGQDYVPKFYAEEHGQFDVDDRFEPGVGDRVQLVSGYAPTTVNLYDAMFAVSDGQVVSVWPVFPRGPGHSGFLTSLQRG